MYYVTSELYHHGILGMKWGKRNGPPYPLSPGDHSKSEKDAGWRKSLNDSSGGQKEPGKITKKLADHYSKEYEMMYGGHYTHDAAQKAGMDKAKIMKRVAIGAGVVVGVGIAAYVYKEYGRNFADGLISNGTTIQTLSVDPDRMEKGLAFYTAFTKADKDSYMSFFGKDRYTGANKEIIQALVNKDIRIAGTKTGEKVFEDLMRSDSDFAKTVSRAIRGDWSELPYAKTDYQKYNIMLVRQEYDEAHKKFYAALKRLGYGAVADVNDRFNPGIKSHAAIIFDRNDIMRKSISHLDDSMIYDAMGKDAMRKMRDWLLSPVSLVIGSGSALVIASQTTDERNSKKYGKRNQNGEE